MTFIEQPPQVNGRGHLLLSPKLIFSVGAILLRLTLKLFYDNAPYHIVIKEYINEYLNVERKLELELINRQRISPTDRRSRTCSVMGKGSLESAIRKEITEIYRIKTGAGLNNRGTSPRLEKWKTKSIC